MKNKTIKKKIADPIEQISKKLNTLIALCFLKDSQKLNTADGVKMLSRFGLINQDIADILGTTKPTVEVLKSRIKSNKKVK